MASQHKSWNAHKCIYKWYSMWGMNWQSVNLILVREQREEQTVTKHCFKTNFLKCQTFALCRVLICPYICNVSMGPDNSVIPLGRPRVTWYISKTKIPLQDIVHIYLWVCFYLLCDFVSNQISNQIWMMVLFVYKIGGKKKYFYLVECYTFVCCNLHLRTKVG